MPIHSEMLHLSEKNMQELLALEVYKYRWNIVTNNAPSSCPFKSSMLSFIIGYAYHTPDVYDCARNQQLSTDNVNNDSTTQWHHCSSPVQILVWMATIELVCNY